jgi:hypothetical protein
VSREKYKAKEIKKRAKVTTHTIEIAARRHIKDAGLGLSGDVECNPQVVARNAVGLTELLLLKDKREKSVREYRTPTKNR